MRFQLIFPKMIRQNYKWFAVFQSNSIISPRLFCTNPIQAPKSVNLFGNQITLVGRVKNQVLTLDSGFQSFHLRTASKTIGNLIGVTHNIKSRSDITITPFPALKENDLVHINGEIAYERQPNGDKFVSVPHILARNIVQMNNENKSDDLEQLFTESVNEVKLMGTIGSAISDENATIFSIVTNANLTSILKESFFYSDWHRILILDENLRDFVRNNLKLTDRLLIHGEILYNKVDLVDGGIAPQGNILPTRIQKLSSFKKSDESEPQHTQTPIEQTN